MTMAPPIPFLWDGEAMRPLAGYARTCDKHFVVGARYTMAEHEDRSAPSHRHFFAAVNDAWATLPEHLSERFPTAEHLRKYALIRAGYADSRQIVASSRAEAQRLAAFVRPMDEYAIVTVKDAVVTVWTPRSQSQRAMGKAEFQASKDAVLRILDEVLGTAPGAVAENSGVAA